MFLGTRTILCFTLEKNIARCPKMTEKIFFQTIFLKIYLQRRKMHFSRRCRKTLAGRPIFFLSSPQKKWKLKWFSRKNFSSKFAYGHVEYTFDNLIGQNLIKSRGFFAQFLKTEKKLKTFFKKLFLSNCSCKHVECSLGSLAAFFDNRSKLFCSMSRVTKILDSSFWQTCWKIIDWMPESVCSVCENDKKYLIFFSKKLLKWSYRHVENSFHKHAEKFLSESQNFFAYFWKI